MSSTYSCTHPTPARHQSARDRFLVNKTIFVLGLKTTNEQRYHLRLFALRPRARPYTNNTNNIHKKQVFGNHLLGISLVNPSNYAEL